MKTGQRLLALLFAVFMAAFCTGCMAGGVEELYSLPKISEGYLQLQSLIDQRIESGGEYAAPIGGSYRQSVQLQDLDGDNVPEALAFMADSSHTPAVCVYRRDAGGDYYLYVVISGEGSAVSSVEYADLNGDGAAELLIEWQISGDIHLLSVYTLSGDNPTQILSADCSEFLLCDPTGSGREQLADLRINYNGTSTLVLYSVDENNIVSSATAALSSNITAVRRVRMDYLSDGTPALFVESDWGEGGLITDVFTAKDGALANITMTATGYSGTFRTGQAFATDINGDRVMEIPSSSGDVLTWYSLDGNGQRTQVMTTYYNGEDGWYLALTDELTSGLNVSVKDDVAGEKAVTFSVTDESGQQSDVLIIYTLTGENRLDRAVANGRFVLKERDTTVYAAELLTDGLTQAEITENFHLIYAEWQAGDL